MATLKEVAEALAQDWNEPVSEDQARDYLARWNKSPDDWMNMRTIQDLGLVGSKGNAPPPPPEVADKYLDAWLPPQDAAKDLS